MPDDADLSQHHIDNTVEIALKNIDATIRGELGECDLCGEVGRLVEGICVPCRRLQEDREKRWKLSK